MLAITLPRCPINEHLGVYLLGRSSALSTMSIMPRPTTTLQISVVMRSLYTFRICKYFRSQPIIGWHMSPVGMARRGPSPRRYLRWRWCLQCDGTSDGPALARPPSLARTKPSATWFHPDLHHPCRCFICSSASPQNCQYRTSPGVFSRYHIYIFSREEGSLSCLRLTQGVTPMNTTRLYRGYVNWG
jgi:hypothetical protein